MQHAARPKAPGSQAMPAQESGSRPARPLPWQPNGNASVDKPAGRLWITMEGGGSQAVPMAIYANAYRTNAPWQYVAPAAGSIKDYFSVQAYGGGLYDLSLYGPNGFLRRFVGNINTVGGQLEVSASYSFATAGRAQLILTMVNKSAAPAVFTVRSNGYRGDGPWTYTVPAGGSASDFWNVQLYTNCWYDFTATVNVDSLFSRRFAGHVELGTASVSG
ncbi:phospholipase domain-containing protein [Chitinimonas koreensis]|uniref:phospholipase domain-containing protein n=1 Tax=Chitinimonas koreensis TaxID=356302 RepID=UPI00223F3199|nr:phospholipase domain-containing protein [Chitinimonas koreensis]